METERIGQASSEHIYFANLFLFYLIAQGGILLIPNAIYWDDWVIFGASSESIHNFDHMLGSFLGLRGHLQVLMLAAGPWLYRISTFILMFASGVLLWHILKRQRSISIGTRYAIVLLFLILPFYSARASLAVFPYTVCYFLFFMAWYLLGKSRLLALLLFVISFTTNSLLVFYALPMAEWYFRDGNELRPRTAMRWGVRRIDFMSLAFIFWFIKTTYFKPYGLYVGYNEDFNLHNLVRSTLFIGDSFLQLKVDLFLVIAFILFGYLAIRKPDRQHGNDQFKFGLAGIVALVCAVFPYGVVGAEPVFELWGSSNQLLMPLGTSLLFVWLLMRLPFEIRRAALALLIAFSVALNVQVYTVLYQDWGKKKELLSLVSKNDEIRNSRLVVFDDRTEISRHIQYPFYEWNGLMKLAYGDEIRFGLNPSQVNLYSRGGYEHYFRLDMAWNARKYARKKDQKVVFVTIEDVGRPSTYGKLVRFVRGEANYRVGVSTR